MKNKTYERAQRSFATGISLITSYGPHGQNVMAAEWTMQISYNPMLIAVFIHDGARTLDNIKKTKCFGVNVASEEQSTLVSVAGGYSGSEVDKLKIHNLFRLINRPKGSIPLIDNCVINAECKLYTIKKIGDHTMVVGKVLFMIHDEKKHPLLYHRNKYFKIGKTIAPLRNEMTIGEKTFNMLSQQGSNKFIIKFAGVVVKSKGKFLVSKNTHDSSVYTIPCVIPRKGKYYKTELENHLHNLKLKIHLKGDPMIKRVAMKNKHRILRINFVLYNGTLSDATKSQNWKLIKPDSFLKSLIK